MTGIPALILIILSAALTIGANGLALTLTAVGGSDIGYDASMIGMLGTAYYVGQLTAALATPAPKSTRTTTASHSSMPSARRK